MLVSFTVHKSAAFVIVLIDSIAYSYMDTRDIWTKLVPRFACLNRFLSRWTDERFVFLCKSFFLVRLS